jgi:hypothetical protein
LICLCAPGCGGCGSRPLPLAEVHGKVSYLGVPLRQGLIVFTPDSARGASGPLAQAAIQADGSYVLQSDDKPGAVAGWHRVTVVAVQAVQAVSYADRFPYLAPLIDPKYRDPELSGLTREVKADQVNAIDINLE